MLARTAAPLRADFELAPGSLALVLAYAQRVRDLELLVREQECRLPR